jgi:protein ImuB
MRTIAIGCPRWPIVAHDLDPDTPAAIFFANRVVTASVEAVASGVKKGMRRREAQARCPEIEVLSHDPARDARTFEPIVRAVEAFGPRVEVVRPGLCVMASKGPARYFGGEEALRHKMAEAIDDAIAQTRTHPLHTDDRTRVGIADGPFAASLAAMRATIVEPGETAPFLAPFPIRVLDNAALTDLLMRLGLTTLGDLARLERNKVVARFGTDGEIAHRLASGDDGRLLEPRHTPPDLTVARELDPPAQRVDIAMFAGKAAADELAERLTTLGLACAKLEIEVTTEHGEERARTWRYSSAFTSAAIAERVRWQLEGWLNEGAQLSGGIAHIRLRPQDVGPFTGTRVGFWNRRGEVSDRVRRAIARVQGLLGPRGAQQPAFAGGRHPSEQVALVPWGDPAPEPDTRPWPGRVPSPQPAVLFDRPRRVGVEATRVRLGGRWLDITAWTGPWPVNEKWWDPSAHRRRTRFQVTLEDGSAHLLVRENGDWFVEATYD